MTLKAAGIYCYSCSWDQTGQQAPLCQEDSSRLAGGIRKIREDFCFSKRLINSRALSSLRIYTDIGFANLKPKEISIWHVDLKMWILTMTKDWPLKILLLCSFLYGPIYCISINKFYCDGGSISSEFIHSFIRHIQRKSGWYSCGIWIWLTIFYSVTDPFWFLYLVNLFEILMICYLRSLKGTISRMS